MTTQCLTTQCVDSTPSLEKQFQNLRSKMMDLQAKAKALRSRPKWMKNVTVHSILKWASTFLKDNKTVQVNKKKKYYIIHRGNPVFVINSNFAIFKAIEKKIVTYTKVLKQYEKISRRLEPEVFSSYKYKRKRIRHPISLKDRLSEQQNHCCALCGLRLNECSKDEATPVDYIATFEHVIPFGEGGADDESNLVITHLKCNRDRNIQFIENKKASIIQEPLVIPYLSNYLKFMQSRIGFFYPDFA
jgi:HNH endonuclease